MNFALDTRKHGKRFVLPLVAAAALMAPAAALAEAPNPNLVAGQTPATLPDLAPANPTDVGQSPATLPDLAPANPNDVGRPTVPITITHAVSPRGIFQVPPSSTLPDLAPANPSDAGQPSATLPDLAPANPSDVGQPATALPDLPPANPTQVAGLSRPAPADNLAARDRSASPVVATSDDGFDFGDAGIGVAVVAGACALLLAVAAFFVGRRRRLGASHS